jgi:Cdc6-like AAA superfamily ATPase
VTLATKQGVDQLNRRQDDQLFQDIAEWLMPTNYAIQQTDLMSKVQPETGQWLLNSEKFGAWMSEGKNTLFCPGIPGAGKTMITAILVDHLMTKSRDDHSIGVAYIYCNFRRQYEQLPIHILLSILKQLFQKRPSIPESVKRLYERYKGDKSRPTLTEILEVLSEVSSDYSRVFILVDALDESQLYPRDRAKVLMSLFDLQSRIGANLFATSRSIPDITKEFEGSNIVEISASEADVQKFVDDQMDRLPAFVLRDPYLQDEIKTTISKTVNGMYVGLS